MLLIMWGLWGTRLHWLEGVWFEFKSNSWPTRTWYRKRDKNSHFQTNPVEDQPLLGRWKTWGGTTLGHGGFLGPGRAGGEGIDTKIEGHEHTHTEQYEVAMLVNFLTQLILVSALLITKQDPVWIVHLVLWISGGIFSYVCSMFQAVLRGEDAYRGNINEESAYAQWRDNQ